MNTKTKDTYTKAIDDVVDTYRLGKAVDLYPSWHPLVCNHNSRYPLVVPSAACGYKSLDHTRLFANGFITSPYGQRNVEAVIESVEALPLHPCASITAEVLGVPLYHPNATTILVKCEWNEPLLWDGTVPLAIVMPLILEQELPAWRWGEVAETWETMRGYFLGYPNVKETSPFVNREASKAIKKIWNALINTGMYGPLMVRNR